MITVYTYMASSKHLESTPSLGKKDTSKEKKKNTLSSHLSLG
jgi:hypothetical protein